MSKAKRDNREKPKRTKVGVSQSGLKIDLPAEQASAIGDQIRVLFSPVVESAGLIGDYIRFFRQGATIRAMKRVQEIAAQENKRLEAVPPKILVPWVEGVSLEEPDSPLIDWWAQLLTKAATKENVRPFLVDLMTKIGNQEAALLDDLWKRYSVSLHAKKLPPLVIAIGPYIKGFIEGGVDRIFDKDKPESSEKLYDHLVSLAEELRSLADDRGLGLDVAVRYEGERKFFASKLLVQGATLDVCRSLNLIEQHNESIVGFRNHAVAFEISLLHFSELGIEFMKACRS